MSASFDFQQDVEHQPLAVLPVFLAPVQAVGAEVFAAPVAGIARLADPDTGLGPDLGASGGGTMIGRADDPAEHEAESVARQVVAILRTGSSPAPSGPASAAPAFGAPVPAGLARKAGGGADPLGGTRVGAGVTDTLQRSNGAGQGLSDTVAGSMGAAFGHDFSNVRVHTDGAADTLSRSLGAVAFTQGSDIYFSAGSYAPGSANGQHLLAHELTHVVQNSGPPVRRKIAGVENLQRSAEPIQVRHNASRTATVQRLFGILDSVEEKQEKTLAKHSGVLAKKQQEIEQSRTSGGLDEAKQAVANDVLEVKAQKKALAIDSAYKERVEKAQLTYRSVTHRVWYPDDEALTHNLQARRDVALEDLSNATKIAFDESSSVEERAEGAEQAAKFQKTYDDANRAAIANLAAIKQVKDDVTEKNLRVATAEQEKKRVDKGLGKYAKYPDRVGYPNDRQRLLTLMSLEDVVKEDVVTATTRLKDPKQKPADRPYAEASKFSAEARVKTVGQSIVADKAAYATALPAIKAREAQQALEAEVQAEFDKQLSGDLGFFGTKNKNEEEIRNATLKASLAIEEKNLEAGSKEGLSEAGRERAKKKSEQATTIREKAQKAVDLAYYNKRVKEFISQYEKKDKINKLSMNKMPLNQFLAVRDVARQDMQMAGLRVENAKELEVKAKADREVARTTTEFNIAEQNVVLATADFDNGMAAQESKRKTAVADATVKAQIDKKLGTQRSFLTALLESDDERADAVLLASSAVEKQNQAAAATGSGEEQKKAQELSERTTIKVQAAKQQISDNVGEKQAGEEKAKLAAVELDLADARKRSSSALTPAVRDSGLVEVKKLEGQKKIHETALLQIEKTRDASKLAGEKTVRDNRMAERLASENPRLDELAVVFSADVRGKLGTYIAQQEANHWVPQAKQAFVLGRAKNPEKLVTSAEATTGELDQESAPVEGERVGSGVAPEPWQETVFGAKARAEAFMSLVGEGYALAMQFYESFKEKNAVKTGDRAQLAAKICIYTAEKAKAAVKGISAVVDKLAATTLTHQAGLHLIPGLSIAVATAQLVVEIFKLYRSYQMAEDLADLAEEAKAEFGVAKGTSAGLRVGSMLGDDASSPGDRATAIDYEQTQNLADAENLAMIAGILRVGGALLLVAASVANTFVISVPVGAILAGVGAVVSLLPVVANLANNFLDDRNQKAAQKQVSDSEDLLRAGGLDEAEIKMRIAEQMKVGKLSNKLDGDEGNARSKRENIAARAILDLSKANPAGDRKAWFKSVTLFEGTGMQLPVAIDLLVTSEKDFYTEVIKKVESV